MSSFNGSTPHPGGPPGIGSAGPSFQPLPRSPRVGLIALVVVGICAVSLGIVAVWSATADLQAYRTPMTGDAYEKRTSQQLLSLSLTIALVIGGLIGWTMAIIAAVMDYGRRYAAIAIPLGVIAPIAAFIIRQLIL